MQIKAFISGCHGLKLAPEEVEFFHGFNKEDLTNHTLPYSITTENFFVVYAKVVTN